MLSEDILMSRLYFVCYLPIICKVHADKCLKPPHCFPCFISNRSAVVAEVTGAYWMRILIIFLSQKEVVSEGKKEQHEHLFSPMTTSSEIT